MKNLPYPVLPNNPLLEDDHADAATVEHDARHGRCSKGWGARCAASKGKRCKCQCGGKNHGGLRNDGAQETLPLTKAKDIQYQWDEEPPTRLNVLVPGEDRWVHCIRVTRPGPFGEVCDARVFLVDGDSRTPLPRRYVYHSPTGFEWGYGGSGPADLALNILALVVPVKEAWRMHHDFKFARVASLPRDEGRIHLADVRQWIDSWYDRMESITC